MIWRQVEQRMTRVKLQLFPFHLIFVKVKAFYTILALKQPTSEKRIFAVYKYSRRLLRRTLSSKFLSNNLQFASSICIRLQWAYILSRFTVDFEM